MVSEMQATAQTDTTLTSLPDKIGMRQEASMVHKESTVPIVRPVQYTRSTSSLTHKSQVGALEKSAEQHVAVIEPNSDKPPSHGRLLPLGQFLIVYACMSLAVLLNSLDQTIGKLHGIQYRRTIH